MIINKKYICLSVSVITALLLSGCATTSNSNTDACDPANQAAGFFEMLGCELNGGYRQSVDKHEEALVAARNENLQFQEIYRQIEAQKNNTRASLNEQKTQNSALNQSLSRLLNTVRTKHANQADVQRKVNQLEEQLRIVQKGSTNSDTATMKRKQKELENLEAELKTLQNLL